MEILPPLVTSDRVVALAGHFVVMAHGYEPQSDQVAPVEGVSRDDHLPPDLEVVPSKEVVNGGSRSTTKWWLAYLDSPLTEGAISNTVGRRLCKK